MSNKAKDIFEQLIGQWYFDRDISNQGHMSGSAQFTLDDSDHTCLIYQESGIHQLIDDIETPFSQKYFYRLKNQIIEVFNARDEKMLDLAFDTDCTGKGDYMCALDHYAAVLEFQDKKSFTLQYTIKGPNKDYQIKTRFKRLDN